MTDLNSADYLTQLLKDKKQLAAFPNVFVHLERLLDEEINRVRVNLFQLGSKEIVPLPEPSGPSIQLTEKLYVPVKEHPEFNFVGRILGPRGMTAKQLEQETGCKIMVRGKGSMRDKAKEEQMKGKPNWEHLNDDLHVLVTVEDTKNRAEVKIKRAVEEIKKLLVPSIDGDDELKKKQLIELAIINGKYKQEAAAAANNFQQTLNQILFSQAAAAAAAGPQFILANGAGSSPHINALSGAPILISPSLDHNGNMSNGNSSGATLSSAASSQPATPTGLTAAGLFATAQASGTASAVDAAQAGLIYATTGGAPPGTTAVHAIYHQPGEMPTFIEYTNPAIDFSQAGPMKGQKIINGTSHLRAHPYSR